jgi:putative membrane protein (TIGR04086 family)
MVRTHRSTSWGSILGGWLAALGALAIFLPLTALAVGLSPAAQTRRDDPTLAIPLVLGLLLSYVVGGYVAGRMAGYKTAWHGFMSAIFGLFVAFVLALIAGGTTGYFANVTTLPAIDVSAVNAFANTITIGAVLGFLAAIIGGWLGGLIAPSRPALAPAAAAAPVHREERRVEEPAAERRRIEERPRVAGRPAQGGFFQRLTQPMAGRKGGERAEPEERR